MDYLELDTNERTDISKLLHEVACQYDTLEPEEFLDRAPVLAHELPRRVRAAVNDFRLGRLGGSLIISGREIDQAELGPTPSHWCERSRTVPAQHEELLLILYACLLGDPFCWATQQDGKLVHDVLPIKGHEHRQMGTSSEELLTWHTEDAFHPLRGDYVVFACLRNPVAAATTVGQVDDLALSPTAHAALFDERFLIRPDESHRPESNTGAFESDFTGIERMNEEPDRVSIYFGDHQQPYVRIDPYFMVVPEDDQVAREALGELIEAVDQRMRDVRLQSGDYCFLDNFRVVHGRKPFKATFDGSDRWLKRINVTCDLRKSRAARLSRSSRAIQ